jgi:nucleolar complex protein 3
MELDPDEDDQARDEVESMSEEDEESELPDGSSVLDSEEEQPYERMPRSNQDKSMDSEPRRKTIARLPIKLASGQIQQTGIREGSIELSSEEEEEEPHRVKQIPKPPRSNIAGPRFGRAALTDIIQIKSREERLTVAKDQIAGICQDILAEPENGVRGFLNLWPSHSY